MELKPPAGPLCVLVREITKVLGFSGETGMEEAVSFGHTKSQLCNASQPKTCLSLLFM